jgi:hypothetical protein
MRITPGTCNDPVGYEVAATSDAITVQFACSESDSTHVIEQLRAHFPDAVCSQARDVLAERRHQFTSSAALVVGDLIPIAVSARSQRQTILEPLNGEVKSATAKNLPKDACQIC